MRFKTTLLFTAAVLSAALLSGCTEPTAKAALTRLDEKFKYSLVYLNVTANSYENSQPWKRSGVAESSGYGCAVGEYEILTTAWNVSDSTFIKARKYGQNEFISAKIKVIDYESNLCLLELDPDAMAEPLVPIEFSEGYDKGAAVKSYWLSAGGHLTTGRGILDRAEVNLSTVSFAQTLDYVVANAPGSTGRGSLYCMSKKPIGIANWANLDSKESGLIPGVVINQFLADAGVGEFTGFASVGFSAKKLIDPATRKYLKMDDQIKNGVYVSKVFNLGTGSEELIAGDVILSIDGNELNAYGRFEDPVFGRILYHHLVSSHADGEEIKFIVWRDGAEKELAVKAKRIKVDDMLVDYYEYDKQPEYIITAGYVIQKLTRPYLRIWGDSWQGNAPPHLYHYYRDMAFNPTEDREDVVVLSYVLPADINQGYHSLGRLVVSKFNGMEIRSIEDILKAQKSGGPSLYDVIEFEHDYPTVVIDKSKKQSADMFISQTYGIQKLVNIDQ